MKRYKGLDIAISAIAFIVVVIVAGILGILKSLEVLKFEATTFMVIMMALTLGLGAYLTIFAIIKKGGYELAVGSVILIIGISLLLTALEVNYVITIIVAIVLLLVAIFSLFLLKSSKLEFITTDKEEGYEPYMDKIKREKEAEKEDEIPEIKSFK